jgi:hypothetical protein
LSVSSRERHHSGVEAVYVIERDRGEWQAVTDLVLTRAK